MWSAILVGPLEEAPPSSLDFSCGFNCTCFHVLCGVWAIFSPNCLGPGFRLTVLFIFFTFFFFSALQFTCLPARLLPSLLPLVDFSFFSELRSDRYRTFRSSKDGERKKKEKKEECS